MSDAARTAYMHRVCRVARVVEEHARKIGSQPVEAAESMKPRTWEEAFVAARVTFAPTMIPDIVTALRSGGSRHGDEIPSDILRPSVRGSTPTIAPHVSESAHTSAQSVR